LRQEIVDLKKEKEKLNANKLKEIQHAYVLGYDKGFKKALHKVALLAPKLDLNKFSVAMYIRDGKLVRENQIDTFNESEENEVNSKVGDSKVTSLSTPI